VHAGCHFFHLCVCCVCIGSSAEFKAEADSRDKSEIFEINREDIIDHDDKSRPYLCTVCDRRFAAKYSLNRHRRIHAVDEMYSCSECEKCFSSQDALRGHKYIHTGKYKCTLCSKCFANSSHLARHRRSHSGEKPFECSVCSKQFTQAEALVRHSKIHSELYMCSLCNKSFSESSVLQRHKHHVHSNRRPYQCHCCGKMFKTNCDMKRRVSTYIGAKLYSCGHCSKRFISSDQLVRHLLKSHDEGS